MARRGSNWHSRSSSAKVLEKEYGEIMSENALLPSLRIQGGALLVPGSLGNLDAYITAVNRIPMLSAEEENALARGYREQGDLNGAGQLVLSHLRLVVAVARSYLGYGLPH